MIENEPRYCDKGSAWHIVSVDRRIGETDRVVLFKIASGLRAHEIARDIGESESRAVNRTKQLMLRFVALSRANLVILAAWYVVINPRAIATTDERRTQR